jgi:F0F1-type ATP synthase delta subunit
MIIKLALFVGKLLAWFTPWNSPLTLDEWNELGALISHPTINPTRKRELLNRVLAAH